MATTMRPSFAWPACATYTTAQLTWSPAPSAATGHWSASAISSTSPEAYHAASKVRRVMVPSPVSESTSPPAPVGTRVSSKRATPSSTPSRSWMAPRNSLAITTGMGAPWGSQVEQLREAGVDVGGEVDAEPGNDAEGCGGRRCHPERIGDRRAGRLHGGAAGHSDAEGDVLERTAGQLGHRDVERDHPSTRDRKSTRLNSSHI